MRRAFHTIRPGIRTVIAAVLLLSSSLFAASPKQIIVMIADGWGFNQVAATRYWHGRPQVYEGFPVRQAMSTYSWSTLEGDPDGKGYDPARAWSDFKYLLQRPTDSASSATAMSTGVMTYDGGLNVDPVSLQVLTTVCELAERQGKSTGVITTVPFPHATPAGYMAHDVQRRNYAEIAAEMLDSTGAEVIMGAGHPFYDANGRDTDAGDYKYVGGRVKWDELVSGRAGGLTPWTLIETRAAFQALAIGDTPARLCGVPRAFSTTNQERIPVEAANEPQAPYTIPRNETVPTLAELTRGGLNVLDNNAHGFLVMIEGGAVDWACHDNQQGRMIEEMIEFGEAVQAVVDWVERSSNWDETLLVVTGDHECGYLWGPDSGDNRFNPVVDRGAGVLPEMHFYSDGHSNSLVPFYARGAGSERLVARADERDPVRGNYLHNAEFGQVLTSLLKDTPN